LRCVTVIALTIIAAGGLATTQMTQPWHLHLLWGLVVGTGSGCMATVFASTVATRWFDTRRGVVPTIALCVQIFGRQHGPLVYGWVFAGHQVGGALAAWGAGELFAITGSYRASFVMAGVGCLIAAVGVLRIDRRPVAWTHPLDVVPA